MSPMLNETGKLVVAHLVQTYLFLTGSWIYNQISTHQEFVPIVIARRLQNLDEFPLSPDRLFHYREFIAGRSLVAAGIRRAYQALTHSRERFYTQTLQATGARLLHAHFGPEGYLALPVKRKTGLPLVTTFYGADMSKLPRNHPAWRQRYRKLFREGDLFLCEGEHMAQQVQQLGCPPEKLRVHHLGIDVERIAFMPRTLHAGEPVRLVMAASFREKKGIPYAIEAFIKAYAQFPNMEFRIIGGVKDNPAEASILQSCRSRVAHAGLESKVFFLGYLQYANYLQEMTSAHLFLAPSVTAMDGDSEGGAPVSIIEASAAGLPVISSWHCDIPGVVLHEQSGLLVEERDADGLADAILKMVLHPERWQSLGEAGRRHIEKEFNVFRQAHRLEAEIYDPILSRRSQL